MFKLKKELHFSSVLIVYSLSFEVLYSLKRYNSLLIDDSVQLVYSIVERKREAIRERKEGRNKGRKKEKEIAKRYKFNEVHGSLKRKNI